MGYRNTLWVTRDWSKTNKSYQVIQTEGDEVKLSFFPEKNSEERTFGVSVKISRADARLLHRRLGQFLECIKK